jgi:hypothetical protein
MEFIAIYPPRSNDHYFCAFKNIRQTGRKQGANMGNYFLYVLPV